MEEFPHLDELIPQSGPMRLIDRVISEGADSVCIAALIRSTNIFYEPSRGVPAYVGVEYMAQAISAYDGLERWRRGLPPTIGYLLGCRRYSTTRRYFHEGETLLIEVTSLLGEGALASFDCHIKDADGQKMASGVINVYRPSDPQKFLER